MFSKFVGRILYFNRHNLRIVWVYIAIVIFSGKYTVNYYQKIICVQLRKECGP